MDLQNFNEYQSKINQFSGDIKTLLTQNLMLFKNSSEALDNVVNYEQFEKRVFNLKSTNDDKILKVVMLGQYNAGKSSLLAALTDAEFLHSKDVNGQLTEVYQIPNSDKTIEIGAQIVTSISQEYDWQNVLLVDTPGVQTVNPNHDQETYTKIEQAHLIIFVISTELFSPESADLFRRVALGNSAKFERMVLVVNKKSTNINPLENLMESILPVISPLTKDNFEICFTDSLDYLNAKIETDESEKQYLFQRSKMEDLKASLKRLIRKNNYKAFLLQPIDSAIALKEDAINYFDSSINQMKEQINILSQTHNKIQSSRDNLRLNIDNILNALGQTMRSLSNQFIDFILSGKHKEKVIEQEYEKLSGKYEEVIKQCAEEIEKTVKEEIESLEKVLNDYIESPNVKANFRGFDNIRGAEGSFWEFGKYLKGIPDLLKPLSNSLSGLTKDIVYNTFKWFGVKFKPWGAVKWTNFLKNLGTYVQTAAWLLELIGKFTEEQAKKDNEKELEEVRLKMEKTFLESINLTIEAIWKGYVNEKTEDEDKEAKNQGKGIEEIVFKDIFDKQIQELTSNIQKFKDVCQNIEGEKAKFIELQNDLYSLKIRVNDF